MKFKGATSRGFCGVLAQTILEISGSQLNPLITFSLNIYNYKGRYNLKYPDYFKTHRETT